MIEQLKPLEDGTFEDPSGCSWSSRADYLLLGILPCCGCGNPYLVGKYIKEMLLRHVHQTGSGDYSCWECTNHEDFPDVMFFLSWATNKGYIEHGSTVRCSWMTPEGEELLRDLNDIEEEAKEIYGS